MKLVSYRDEFSFQGPIEPYDIHLKEENDLSSRPVWSADRVPEQPGRSREILGCGGYECLLCDATFLARGDTCLLIPDWKPKTDLTLTQPFMPAKYKLVNSEFWGLLTRIWVKVTYIRRKDSKTTEWPRLTPTLMTVHKNWATWNAHGTTCRPLNRLESVLS